MPLGSSVADGRAASHWISSAAGRTQSSQRHKRGLVAHGISFHVGSQQHNVEAWDRALASAAAIFRSCAERGVSLAMVNLGGGFPARYVRKTPKLESYGKAIFRALRRHFGNALPETIIEPGRGLVGNAGIIEAEVVLIAKRLSGSTVIPRCAST